MKKALAVLVLLGTFSVCTSVFGDYLLEYNLNISMKGVDVNNNLSENMPMKAFLVMTFSDVDNSLVDANLILYGKDPSGDLALKKVFTQLNMTGDVVFLTPEVTELGDFVAIDLFAEDPFGFEMLIIGKTKSTNIGTGTNQIVAGSLKGVIWMFYGVLISQTEDIEGTGNVTASLATGPTKALNVLALTQDDAVNNILTTKLSKYTEILIEP